jgi:signal transduction histidine kinase
MRMRRVLLAAFGGIAAIVALGNFLGTWRAHRARAEVEPALAEAFAGIELVNTLSRDVTRERLLVETHIAEKDRRAMERIGAHIAGVDRAISTTAAEYDKLALEPDEARIWQDVRAELEALRTPIRDVLAVSLENRDVEAQRQLEGVDDRFVHLGSQLAGLVEINRRDGLRALQNAFELSRTTNLVASGLALVAIVLTLGVGTLATWLVGRRERQMVVYADRLEQQNRELDAFAGRVAHDLRGPLTTMGMAASRMMEQRPDDGMGGLVKRSVARMERLIRDLLALSQVESQARGAVCNPAAVAALVRDELQSRVEDAQATLRVDVQPAAVQTKDGLLVEALINLAENAIKYARPDTPPVVELRGRVVGGEYQLAVSDNGLGMSPDEARQAFQPFYRARRAPETPGTGLGLSIVKRVAESSGGSITLESTLGRGSTFVLHLPLRA